MPRTTSSEFTLDGGSRPKSGGQWEWRAARSAGSLDILKDNPVLTLVAVGVLGFAVGTLAGRSSVRRRGTFDANLDSLQNAIDAARSGAADTVGSWTQALRSEGLLPEQFRTA